ncbi:tyrosine phosphatase family protein [Bosea sp. PAMC 26642]|uniref:tyrosine phosphatase family protein n=1 Tax=Bosea sp. (strain PAMC 26642) TaxID=1792307 RepID=UPI00076FE2A9|nr:protein-tyrosine phosphatase family protein [Bosea sp. PAMC 26642]AMJ59106.1 protein tyrosine phosphatase [Bosea sp. PAMC 26642]
MPTLHVSSLSKLHETVAAVRASHVVTLINVNTVVECPPGIDEERHLFLGMSDITTPMDGHIVPGEEHVARFLRFMREWDRAAPIVIHCWAGISRSTAAAYIAACALGPDRDEDEIALRLRAASPSATPNARLVALGDAILGRDGRMQRAIARIGRGAEAFEGAPFEVELT